MGKKNPSPCNNLLMVSYEQEVLCVETAAAGTSCDSSTLHTIKKGNEAQGVSVMVQTQDEAEVV